MLQGGKNDAEVGEDCALHEVACGQERSVDLEKELLLAQFYETIW